MIRRGSTLAGLAALAIVTGPALAQGVPAADTLPPEGRTGAAYDARDLRNPVPPFATLRLAQASDAGKGSEPLPMSREALFGAPPAEPKPAYRIGGFVQGTAAYTFEDPDHWSRAVGRLYVAAQGTIADALKWKASGRVDGDVVYASSNFYLDPVKEDQRLDFFWGENYLDFSAGSWDFRIGAQHIVWGEVVGLFVADVVSAHDMREFLLPSFDLIRIPQWAARAEYTSGDAHVEFVWIPVPVFDNIGKPGSDFYPAPLPSPTPSEVAALFENPEKPSRKLDNSSYGIRANTLVAGWDLAAFYYRSYSVAPTFYREPSTDASQPFVFRPRYDRIWQAGGTVSKDFGEVVLRGEAVYTGGKRFALADLTAAESTVERDTLDYIVSLEITHPSMPPDARVNVQGFQRVYFDGGGGDLAIRDDGFGASILLSTKLGSAFEPQLLWIQNFKDGGGMVRPRLNWTPAKNTSVAFGVDVFTGSSDGFFGRYDNRDRVYVEARFDF